jgi:hypothetical protein
MVRDPLAVEQVFVTNLAQVAPAGSFAHHPV